MTGAEWVVRILKELGVKTVFGYPGGAIMPIYDALYTGGLEHVLCRHEQGAIIAAIGYARASCQIGVCLATSGPGATNLITGLADAFLDSVPVIAITGQVPSSMIGMDAFQEVDVLGLSLACTKHSFLVESLDTLPQILIQAIDIAKSDRPGPVLIDIPKDIQVAHNRILHYQLPLSVKAELPPKELLGQAYQLLLSAKKPILYVGGGVGMAGAVDSVRAFIKRTKIPVVATLKGLGVVEKDYPYYLGMLGMHGVKAANLLVQQSDLLIVIGARFDDRVTGNVSTFAPNAKVIHLDIDQAEFGKVRVAEVALQGEINAILPYLSCSLSIREWQQQTINFKELYAWSYAATDAATDVNVPCFFKQLSTRLKASTVVTTDVGQHQMWAAQHIDFSRPENFLTSSGLGTMGFGLPAAIGAQIARPQDNVICISGDGSIMMNIQELATVKRKKLPIKIIIIDNQRLGMVRQWQQLFFDGRYSETNLSDNPDFLVLARAFNIDGERVQYTSQIEGALSRLLESKEAYLLQISINEQENVWPLVPPGASNDAMLERIS